MKALYRMTLLLMLTLLVAACGEATDVGVTATEAPVAGSVGTATSFPVDSVPTNNPATASTAIPANATPATGIEPTVASEAPAPTIPPLPEVVPADPTATQAAGVKPTLIFFTADN